MGWPSSWRPAGARAFVTTYGASLANGRRREALAGLEALGQRAIGRRCLCHIVERVQVRAYSELDKLNTFREGGSDGTPRVWMYLLYLAVSVGLTVWVATTLSRNGRVFLEDVFDDERLANAVNQLLVMGFYLLNLGYVTFAMRSSADVQNASEALETFSTKIASCCWCWRPALLQRLLPGRYRRGRIRSSRVSRRCRRPGACRCTRSGPCRRCSHRWRHRLRHEGIVRSAGHGPAGSGPSRSCSTNGARCAGPPGNGWPAGRSWCRSPSCRPAPPRRVPGFPGSIMRRRCGISR
jgi:hypothetical protein